MRRPQLLFKAAPLRVTVELLLISLVLGGFSLLLFGIGMVSFVPVSQLILITSALGVPWAALRLSRKAGPWWLRRGREACVLAVLCLLESTLLTVTRRGMFVYSAPPFLGMGLLRPVAFVAGLSVIFFCGNYSFFLVVRAIGRGWEGWNRLRRTQLQWALTHAHAMVVAFAVLLLMVMVALILAFSARESVTRWLIPFVVIVVTLGIMAILAIIPPSALFSYLVVRHTVQRIQALAAATSVLRSGNYAVRVPVRGEDEVAQLQADFNAMAADLQRVMRELQQERDTVAGLLQSRRELVASASHELRTPVATLRSSLESTLTHWDEHPEESLQQDLLVMEGEVLHLQTLVEDLFALARADVGRLSLRCEPTNIAALVEAIVAVRAPLAWQASKIMVVADVAENVPMALVDGNRVEQILQNLLHNAVRHTAPGGIVALVVRSEAGRVVLQVKDTGEGIAPEELSHIWSRAAQDPSQNRQTGERRTAPGLGLTLVKEWTEAMSGNIAVESVLGEGSCFSVSFPAVIDAIERRRNTAALPPLTNTPGTPPGMSASFTR